jgi:hypothetical protein
VIPKREATGKYCFGMATHKVLENIKHFTNTRRATPNQNYPHEYIRRSLLLVIIQFRILLSYCPLPDHLVIKTLFELG